MLVVGLTGELGSGKSTVARLFAERGAHVLSSDAMGRALMEPGQEVYRRIVEAFGPGVLQPDGQLNRSELARVAFDATQPRIEELNAIVHPAVLGEQSRLLTAMQAREPRALVIVESALIFTTRHTGDQGSWRDRFDYVILVTAPEALEIERFVARSAGGRALTAADEERLREDARARLQAQRLPAGAAAECLHIDNTGSLAALAHRTEELFQWLRERADHTA